MQREAIITVAIALLFIPQIAANTAPIISNIPKEMVICEGSNLLYELDATDAEADQLTAGISPSSPFFIRALTSGSATTFLEIYSANLTKPQSNKVYEETIFVSDQELIDTREIKITVLEINNPPEISHLGVETISLNSNTTLRKQVNVFDIESGSADSGRLSFSITEPNTANVEIDETGLLTLTPSIEKIGLHEIEVCVTDSAIENLNEKIGICDTDNLRKSSCRKFQLAITEDNAAPTIILHNSSKQEGEIIGTEKISFELFKFDPEDITPDAYWYVDGFLKKITSEKTDAFSYTFGCGVKGRHIVKAEITDGLLNDSVSWTFRVTEIPCAEGIPPGGRTGLQDCEELWGCSDWNVCQDAVQSNEIGILSNEDYRAISAACSTNNQEEDTCGFQIRDCFDTHFCNTTTQKPEEIQACSFYFEPSCSEGIMNCHDGSCEFLADCGGPCQQCATCSDGIKNQGEEKTDCGGPCLKKCPIKEISESERKFKRNIMVVVLILLVVALIEILRIMRTKKKLEEPSKRGRKIQTNEVK